MTEGFEYCDECGVWYDQPCQYHDLHDCVLCGAELSISLHQGGPTPEDVDTWECESCGWSAPA